MFCSQLQVRQTQSNSPNPRQPAASPSCRRSAKGIPPAISAPGRLPPQVLSNLLWAAWGINRPEGKRTVPTANNKQGMDVYAITAKGAYHYDAASNTLKQVADKDLRALTGRQDFVAKAPLNLVYVSDYAKMGSTADQDKMRYSGAHAGFMGQNVYLYCASEGLGTVIRAWFDGPALARALKLRPDQKVILCQTVGYPK